MQQFSPYFTSKTGLTFVIVLYLLQFAVKMLAAGSAAPSKPCLVVQVFSSLGRRTKMDAQRSSVAGIRACFVKSFGPRILFLRHQNISVLRAMVL